VATGMGPGGTSKQCTMRGAASKMAASVGNRAPPHGARLARRCPGRTSKQTRLSSARERGRQRLPGASLSERSEQCKRSEQRRSSLWERRRRRRIHCAMREQPQKKAASVGNRAPAHGEGASRGVLPSGSDDDGGGFTARCASSLKKGPSRRPAVAPRRRGPAARVRVWYQGSSRSRDLSGCQPRQSPR
jgi:hypothetical protein